MIISEKYLSYHLIVTCLWMYSMIFGRFQSFLSGEGNGNPLQYSCLENPTDGGAWWAAVHGVANSRTQLSNFIFTFLHWRRKWQPTPVLLPGESHGRRSLVRYTVPGVAKSQTRLSDFTFTFTHWRRQWQPTPVFLPGESQGRTSLVGCRLWGRTESDTTEAT